MDFVRIYMILNKSTGFSYYPTDVYRINTIRYGIYMISIESKRFPWNQHGLHGIIGIVMESARLQWNQ